MKKQPSTTEDEENTTYPSIGEIKGISKTAKKRLYAKGIDTVDKFVNLPVSELAAFSGVSSKTIEERDWLGQAHQLVQEISSQEGEIINDDNGQHYVGFSLELMLNEDNSVRRTKIFDIANETAREKWEGWDEERLVAVIAEMAGVQRSSVKAERSAKSESQPVSPTGSSLTAKGKVQLRQLDALLGDTDNPRHLVPHDQPFRLCIALDLVDVDAPDDSELDYIATIYAKKLGTGERQFVTKQQNTVPLQSRLSIPIDGVSMPPGTFRLQTVVNLNLPQTARDFTTSMEGGILQVY